jgi:hypothetical protein
MGRKNRVRITKEQNVKDESSGEESEDDPSVYENAVRMRQFDILWNVRMHMIEYCDEMSIPLCDYLDQNTMIDFIEFLSET